MLAFFLNSGRKATIFWCPRSLKKSMTSWIPRTEKVWLRPWLIATFDPSITMGRRPLWGAVLPTVKRENGHTMSISVSFIEDKRQKRQNRHLFFFYIRFHV